MHVIRVGREGVDPVSLMIEIARMAAIRSSVDSTMIGAFW